MNGKIRREKLWTLLMILILISIMPTKAFSVSAALYGEELQAYEKYLKKRQTVICKSASPYGNVTYHVGIDSFNILDIDNDKKYEMMVILKHKNPMRGQECCTHRLLCKYKNGSIKIIDEVGIVNNEKYFYVSPAKKTIVTKVYPGIWYDISVDGSRTKMIMGKVSLSGCKKYELYKNNAQNRKKYIKQVQQNITDTYYKGELISTEKNMKELAIAFAKVFAKNAKETENIRTENEKKQLEDLKKQLTITGYRGKVPDEVLEAFTIAVFDTIKASNIKKYETNQNKLVKQIYRQIDAGLKSGTQQIVIGKGSKKMTYMVKYTIFAQSYSQKSVQVSWADVTWKDTRNKQCTVHIVANSTDKNMKMALASYCAVLAQLNKDIWKEFLVKYVTDGWKLASLNTIRKLDDRAVAKFFDRSEYMILTMCGDKKAKQALLNDAKGELKTKLKKMTKKQFEEFIKSNISNGDKLIKMANKYKKIRQKYNDCKKKLENWKKTRKNSDLGKYENVYEQCQSMMDSLNTEILECY